MPKVLFVLTSHGTLGDTGRKTGFSVPEVAHPAALFAGAGWEVSFASVRGGAPPHDGVRKGDEISRMFLEEHAAQLARTPAVGGLRAADYDAVYLVGGHGTMWDFPEDAGLAALAAEVYEAGGIVAAVCHGPAGLLDVTLPDGTPLVAGRMMSAFTNEEERAVGLDTVVPFLLETALGERGARMVTGGRFAEQAVADGRLVSGQNPASAARVAELVLERYASA